MHQNTRITVKDLARICGVSIGTVDRALNNRGRINPDTKEKILAAADEYGYIKNQFACTLSSGKSNLIGVIVLNLRNEYFPALLSGVDAEAHARGYSTLFMISDYSPDEEKRCVDRMLSMNVAGIIVCSVLTDASRYRRVIEGGIPLVAVSTRLDGIPYTGIDDYSAMRDAAAHIASCGWDKIYYISPVLAKKDQNISAQSERLRGFMDAVTEVGMDYELVADKEAFAALTPDTGIDSALLCSSDVYTQRCIVRFRKEIEDGTLGLMGFDNITSLRMLYPELATVSYDTRAIGAKAVKQLFESDQDPLIPYTIIKGNTI